MTSQVPDLEGFQLSPQQRHVWRKKVHGEVAGATIEIHGPLDQARLEQALNQIIERHEVLRTSFVSLPGMTYPIQQIESTPSQITLSEPMGTSRPTEQVAEPPLLGFKLREDGPDAFSLEVKIASMCADRGSLQLLFRELAEAYGGDISLATGAEEALQYVDFATWQHELLEEDETHFWQHLRNPSASETANSEEGQDTNSPKVIHARMSPSQGMQLRAHLQTFEGDAETFWFAAWFFFLHRSLGSDTHRLTKRTNQRKEEPLDTVFGPMDQFLPIHLEVNPQQRFQQALEDIELLAHQADDHSFSFDWEHVSAVDDGSLPGFAFNEVEPDKTIGDVRFRFCQAAVPHANRLLLQVFDREDGGFDVQMAYAGNGFAETKANHLLQGYLRFARAAAANPKQTISRLPILSEGERHQLATWNTTSDSGDTDSTVHQRFQEQAERTPDAVAIRFGAEQITYGALASRANQLAHLLCRRGVGPECFVPLVAERSIDAVIGLLAILKSGGAFVVIDPQQPANRATFILEDLKASVGLIQAKHLSLSGEWGFDQAHWITLESGAEAPVEPPQKTSFAEQAAYMIYTSGSTGQPKGCVISHGSLLNLGAGLQEKIYRDLGSERRVTLNAPLIFDASVKQWLQLLSGHTLIIVEEDTRIDGQAMLRFLDQVRPHVLDLTPSQLQILFYAGLQDNPSLWPQRMLIGGEAIDEALWRSLHALAAKTCFNVYGPSECTDVTTTADLSQSAPTIGTPIVNSRVLLLDDQLEPVPIGNSGELCIAGEGVGRGYFNRPALTAQRFLPNARDLDPHATPGSRLYRSGDLARFQDDGAIDYLERLDFQIKLRGFRVEPGEIEAAFLLLPEVRQCIVKPHQGEKGQTYLVAYIVANQASADPMQYLQQVRQSLPIYMVPQKAMLLDRFPLTRHGKIDRNALPAPVEEDAEQGQVRPTLRPTEDILWSIWTDLLEVKNPGLDTSFFELGGHSLLATQLMSRVRHTLDVALSLSTIFEAPTIRSLAAKVEHAQQDSGNEWMAPPVIVPASRQTPLPQSFVQQRLWFVYSLDPSDTAYNMPSAFRIKGHLNPDLLRKTLSLLIERHEILRTTFAEHHGQPVQMIGEAKPIHIALDEVDPQADPLALAEQALTHEADKPFDLVHGPLLRLRLLRLNEHDHIALFTMHHIIADAWSNALLVRELVSIYQALVDGRVIEQEPLSIQYGDFAAWQVSWLRGNVYRQHVEYWRRQLGGEMPLTKLPFDRPRSERSHNMGKRATFSLDPTLSKAIIELGHTYGTTTFMTLLSGFLVLLYRHGNRSQVPVGMVIAGRDRLETESLIGCLINMLVLRFNLENAPTFRDLLTQVRQVTLEAYEYQAMPFDRLVRELNPKREKGISPLFQTSFGMKNAPLSNLNIANLDIEAIEIATERIRYDLTLWAFEEEDRLSVDWTYASALFDDDTIAAMAQQYEELLQAIVAQPEARIFALAPDSGKLLGNQKKQASLNNRMRGSRRKIIG